MFNALDLIDKTNVPIQRRVFEVFVLEVMAKPGSAKQPKTKKRRIDTVDDAASSHGTTDGPTEPGDGEGEGEGADIDVDAEDTQYGGKDIWVYIDTLLAEEKTRLEAKAGGDPAAFSRAQNKYVVILNWFSLRS